MNISLFEKNAKLHNTFQKKSAAITDSKIEKPMNGNVSEQGGLRFLNYKVRFREAYFETFPHRYSHAKNSSHKQKTNV